MTQEESFFERESEEYYIRGHYGQLFNCEDHNDKRVLKYFECFLAGYEDSLEVAAADKFIDFPLTRGAKTVESELDLHE